MCTCPPEVQLRWAVYDTHLLENMLVKCRPAANSSRYYKESVRKLKECVDMSWVMSLVHFLEWVQND